MLALARRPSLFSPVLHPHLSHPLPQCTPKYLLSRPSPLTFLLNSRTYCTATQQAEERPIFIVTDRCAEKINSIKELDKNSKLKLRVAVDSGGCSGYKYDWTLTDDEPLLDEDYVYERNGAQVIVDKESMKYLAGSRIDFTDEMIGKKFKILDNPQAGKSCGCGTSFNPLI